MEALAVFVSLIALVIACWQWAIADQRIRIELFQNRIRIYRAVQDALNVGLESHGPTEKSNRALLLAVSEARWMFDKEIYEFLNDRVLADCVVLESTILHRIKCEPEHRRELTTQAADLKLLLLDHLKQLPDMCGPLLNIERRSLLEVIISWRSGVYKAWRQWCELDES